MMIMLENQKVKKHIENITKVFKIVSKECS